jgi:thiamine-phosphate pyrophosphorylase
LVHELRLTLVTDRGQTRGRELVTVVGECLAAGLPAVQVREKDLGAGDLAFVCRRIRALTLDAEALLVVNDRVDVALAVGAEAEYIRADVRHIAQTIVFLASEKASFITGVSIAVDGGKLAG